jgi:hypothetical protein
MDRLSVLRLVVAGLAAIAVVIGFKKRVGIIVAELRRARSPDVSHPAPRAERIRFLSAAGAMILFVLIGITAALGGPVKVVYAMLMLLAAVVLFYLIASACSGFAEGRSTAMRNRPLERPPSGNEKRDRRDQG